jgi:hypothetical protein
MKVWRTIIPMQVRISVGLWLYRTFVLPGKLTNIRLRGAATVPDDEEIVRRADLVARRIRGLLPDGIQTGGEVEHAHQHRVSTAASWKWHAPLCRKLSHFLRKSLRVPRACPTFRCKVRHPEGCDKFQRGQAIFDFQRIHLGRSYS